MITIKQLALVELTAAPVLIFTVPVNIDYVIKGVYLCNKTANPETVDIAIKVGALTFYIVNTFTVPANSFETIDVPIAVSEGQELYANASNISAIDMLITGASMEKELRP